MLPSEGKQRSEPEAAVEHQRVGQAAHGAGVGARPLRDSILRLRPRRQGFGHRLRLGRHHRLRHRAARVGNGQGEVGRAAASAADQQPGGGSGDAQGRDRRTDGTDGAHPSGRAQRRRPQGPRRRRQWPRLPSPVVAIYCAQSRSHQTGQEAQQAPIQLHQHHRVHRHHQRQQ